MKKLISFAPAALFAIAIGLSSGLVRAGSSTDGDGNLYGTTTFAGSGEGPDATVDFVVIYGAGGLTLSELNAELTVVGDDISGSADDTADAISSMSAYDETSASTITFLYQVDSTADQPVNSLFIKDFGFTPTKTGVINVHL